jgi:hypothetical protein
LERDVLEFAACRDYRPVFVIAIGLDRFDRLRAVAGHALVSELIGITATPSDPWPAPSSAWARPSQARPTGAGRDNKGALQKCGGGAS